MTKPTATPTTLLRNDYQHSLAPIFSPKNIALIGATEKAGSVGRALLWNLITNPFGGTVFPINPKRASVLGIKSYPRIAEVPAEVDLAIIVTPAALIPGIIEECGLAGVKGAIIISAGFKETGPAGAALEQQILTIARRTQMRIIGPNCLGVMRPLTGLNATFAHAMAKPGTVAFISQSGALCTAVLDWSLKENVGFSAFISIGSMVDVGWGDMIDYLSDDPQTKSIVIYMESIGNARSFLSAAREAALTKPIIIIKGGRTGAAAKAATSHTGALAGSDEVLEAAFRRSGVLRVNSIEDLFYMAEVLATQPRPHGPRLSIITNAGGPGVLATDALIGGDGELSVLSEEVISSLDKFLPAHWSHNNPVDILGDADPARYASAIEVMGKDLNSDALLVILTPQSMTDPTQTAEQLKTRAKNIDKPILASWMGGAEIMAGAAILSKAGIPTFPYPDTAARLFNYMWRYNYNLGGIYETPSLPPDDGEFSKRLERAATIIEAVRAAGRTLLTEVEAKQILAAYMIPVVETRIARSAEEAVKVAGEIGYPVVLKLFSETITHKTDVNGVQLNLPDALAVREAYQAIHSSVSARRGQEHFLGVTVQQMIASGGYEIIIGSTLDAQFGPVLLFGSGGQLVEIYKDHALALPPLNTTLARRMFEQTRIFTALKGTRGRPPVNLAALEHLMVRFSYLAIEQPWIKEIDINPLLATPERLVALDARIILHDLATSEDRLSYSVITPYPTQYVQSWTLKDDHKAVIRPIRPEDEPLIIKFHQMLSERSVYFRWFEVLNLSARIAHERLRRICFIDYDREMALVVEHKDPATGEVELMGVGRLTRLHGVNQGEFALIIADQFQGQGLGKELLGRLQQVGRDWGLAEIKGDILPDNKSMQHVCEKLGFKLHYSMEEQLVIARFTILKG